MEGIIIFFFKLFYSLFITASGIFIGAIVVSQMHNRYTNNLKERKKIKEFSDKYKSLVIRKKFFEDHYNSSTESSDEDSDQESIELITKPNNESDYKDFFHDNYITMEHDTYQTIHMFWSPLDNYYIYYSRSREIPYNILDVLCRKFVLTFDLCDNYVINYEHDYKITNDKEKSNNDDDGYNTHSRILNPPHIQPIPSPTHPWRDDYSDNDEDNEYDGNSEDIDGFEKIDDNNVFSMVKKTEKQKIKQEKFNKEINHFKYGGNLYDFKNRKTKNSKDNEHKEISYKQFKFDNFDKEE